MQRAAMMSDIDDPRACRWRALALAALALCAGCAFSPPLAPPSDLGAATDVGAPLDTATDSGLPLDTAMDSGAPLDAAMDSGLDRPEACQGDACPVGCTGPERALCGGQCVSLSADPMHCGACGSRCSAANAATSCAGGRCEMGACNPGFADCNARAADGCEVNTAVGDVANCGACGRRCPAPPAGATAVCNGGACGISTLMCPSALRDCNGLASDGCETSVITDVNHCGRCGARCSTAGGAASCAGGGCSIACVPGYGNCDGMVANGCETHLGADNRHCGACGNACPGGQACVDGACRLTCSPGQRACSGQCVNVQTDNRHCGACGQLCGSGTVCSSGACTSTCAGGTTACSGVCRDLANDPGHCGACGRACSFPNGVAGCRMGACVLSACAAGFADCDGAAANGCETSTGSDASNCGVCGNRCQSLTS